MLTLTIGMTCANQISSLSLSLSPTNTSHSLGMVIGFILRIAYRGALDSVGIYAIMTLFILLSVRPNFSFRELGDI